MGRGRQGLGPADRSARARSNFLGIESLAADPVDANKVYLAAGTYTGSWVGNGAILRSKDRGNTWQTIDMPVKMGGNENGRSMGERLAIDPNQPSILFFGSRKAGLWKSADGASTWEKVAGFTASDDDKGIGIPIVLFDKASGSKGKPTPVIYAAVANNAGSLYRSGDARRDLEAAPQAADRGDGQPRAVRFDRDAVRQLRKRPRAQRRHRRGGLEVRSQEGEVHRHHAGGADAATTSSATAGCRVDATHPGTLMVSTIDRWTKGDEVFRTTDGGKKWKALFAQGGARRHGRQVPLLAQVRADRARLDGRHRDRSLPPRSG